MYIAAAAHRRRLRLRHHRHPVPAGPEGPGAGLRPGRRPAEQRRPPAGARARGNGRVLYEGEALPHFNEVDECAGLDGLVTNRVWTQARLRSRKPRCTTSAGAKTYNGELRLGVRDLRRRAAAALHRRLRRRDQRAPAADVLPPRRRHGQGRLQARRDRLEPRLRRGRQAEGRHRPRQGRRTAAGGDRAPLAGHHAAVAHHARGPATASRATR